MNYYKSQLDRLKTTDICKSIILSDNTGNKTKEMDLNQESIPLLIFYLTKELSEIINILETKINACPSCGCNELLCGYPKECCNKVEESLCDYCGEPLHDPCDSMHSDCEAIYKTEIKRCGANII